jgi:hypothetical protein
MAAPTGITPVSQAYLGSCPSYRLATNAYPRHFNDASHSIMRFIDEASSSSRSILKSHDKLPRRRRCLLPQFQNL